MTISGYPLWIVFLISLGVFFASFVDAIGGGGGIISVPIYLLAGLPAHAALGTNKLSACVGTAASTYRYIKNKYVDWSLAIPGMILAPIGSYFGTKFQLSLDERYLKYLLLIVLPLVAVIILRQKSFPEQMQPLPVWKRQAIVWGASLAIGIYDGLYGPGTGTFLLICYCNLAKIDIRTASGNVKLVNLASNISALITSLVAGKVLVPLGCIAAVFSIAGHYIGAGLTIKSGSKIVRPVILTVLALLALKIAVELIAV